MSDVVIQGDLSGHAFVEVLQLAVGKRERLKIELFDASQVFGEVYLDGMTVLDARVDVLTGLSALGAMLRLSEGQFRVVREALQRPARLNRSLDDALIDCANGEGEIHESTSRCITSVPPPFEGEPAEE
ncbi:MAG: DUF4388 domain-containing protein [Myxococcales bacterium]